VGVEKKEVRVSNAIYMRSIERKRRLFERENM
jgi:hypothetical protein